MKKIYLVILLVTVNTILFGQISYDFGTIQCDRDVSLALVFGSDVDLVLTGNNPIISDTKYKYYDIYSPNNICFIKGNDPNSPSTSIHITLTDGSLYYGYLKYGTPKKPTIDFRQIKDTVKVRMVKDSIANVVISNKGMDAKIKEILAESMEYSMYGVRKNSMAFQITNIRNDANYSYFKIVCNNESGADYNIDNMLFKYQEGKKKGSGKKTAQIEERIMPKYESPTKVLKAYSKTELCYVIPLFSVGNQGNLIIQMMEVHGTRNPKIIIMGEDMLKVGVFKN